MKVAGCSRRHRRSDASFSFGVAVAAIVSIVACSGGAGTAADLRGGPDGIPKSSTDAPGNTGVDSPGNSSQDSSGNCITCSGSFACTSAVTGAGSNQGGTSFVTLAPATGGCLVADSSGAASSDQSILQCGGQFVDVQGGTTAVEGRWTGGSDGFSVTASAQGVSVTVVCAPTTATPVQGGGGTTDTVDAG